jgi:hypothetical protein
MTRTDGIPAAGGEASTAWSSRAAARRPAPISAPVAVVCRQTVPLGRVTVQ